MARKIKVTQPAVIVTELHPLELNMDIITEGRPYKQWYYANDGTYMPNRKITPLVLTPKFTIVYPETREVNNYVPVFQDYSKSFWAYYVSDNARGGGGDIPAPPTSVADLDPAHLSGWTIITNTTQPGEDFFMPNDGHTKELVIRRNVRPYELITLYLKYWYTDKRDPTQQGYVEQFITLVTDKNADIEDPTVTTFNPAVMYYDPVNDSGSQQKNRYFELVGLSNYIKASITRLMTFDWYHLDNGVWSPVDSSDYFFVYGKDGVGFDGKSLTAKAYNNKVAYQVGDVVKYNNMYYTPIQDVPSASTFNTNLWRSVYNQFDANKSYNKGDIVLYKEAYWSCLTDGVSGAWDSEKWIVYGSKDSIIVVDALHFDKENFKVKAKYKFTVVRDYDDHGGYQKDEYVKYNGGIYKAKSQIFVPAGDWDASEWTQQTYGSQGAPTLYSRIDTLRVFDAQQAAACKDTTELCEIFSAAYVPTQDTRPVVGKQYYEISFSALTNWDNIVEGVPVYLDPDHALYLLDNKQNSIVWDCPDIDIKPTAKGSNIVTYNETVNGDAKTFTSIANCKQNELSFDTKDESFLFEWKYRESNVTSTAGANMGYGVECTIDATDLFINGRSNNMDVYPIMYLKGPLQKVKQGGEYVVDDYTGEPVYMRDSEL